VNAALAVENCAERKALLLSTDPLFNWTGWTMSFQAHLVFREPEIA
jgi:hypothetical protein